MKKQCATLGLVLGLGIGMMAFGLLGIVLTLSIVYPGSLQDSFEEEDLRSEWQMDADPGCELELSSTRARQGSKALRITAPEGSRCEIVPRLSPSYLSKLVREPFGEDRWYRFSVFLDPSVAESSQPREGNTVIAQWHSSPDLSPRREAGRGPPLALRIRDGHWGITYGWDEKFLSEADYLASHWQWIGPVMRGEWIDWTFRVRWSYGEDGLTEVWRNGEIVMQRKGPNTYNDFRGVYLKLGLYHPVRHETVYLDRISISDAEGPIQEADVRAGR